MFLKTPECSKSTTLTAGANTGRDSVAHGSDTPQGLRAFAHTEQAASVPSAGPKSAYRGNTTGLLSHGGNLLEAARRYAIPAEHWLDLSTGINANGWPVPPLPASVWNRLPERNDGLEQAATTYYGCANLLPVAGSQAAIQSLPSLFPSSRIGLITPGYAEHEHAWRLAGHRVTPLQPAQIDARLDELDILLLINPSNPTGQHYHREQLLAWQQRLAARGGWLIVDEAFIDTDPRQSLSADCGREGLVVLRSVGKFFGLAGIRAGFVLGPADLLDRLDRQLGPWTLSGPARWVCQQCLADQAWQTQSREDLRAAGMRLKQLLKATIGAASSVEGPSLFKTLHRQDAAILQQQLAERDIWVRYFQGPELLRFGLPANELAWQRLTQALHELSEDNGLLSNTRTDHE